MWKVFNLSSSQCFCPAQGSCRGSWRQWQSPGEGLLQSEMRMPLLVNAFILIYSQKWIIKKTPCPNDIGSKHTGPLHPMRIQLNLVDVLQGVFIHAIVDQINRRVFCLLAFFENLLIANFSHTNSIGDLYFWQSFSTFLQAFFCLVIIFTLACAEHFSFFDAWTNYNAIY